MEARRAQHLAGALHLLDAGREAADRPALLERGVRRGDRVPRPRQVEEHRVGLALQLGREAVRHGVAQLDGHHLGQPEHREVVARPLRPLRVVLERVDVARRQHRPRQRAGERAGAGAGLDDDGARLQVELQGDVADVRRVDDLRAVRQRVRPQLRRRVQHEHEALRRGLLRRAPPAPPALAGGARHPLEAVRPAEQIVVVERAEAVVEDRALLRDEVLHAVDPLVDDAQAAVLDGRLPRAERHAAVLRVLHAVLFFSALAAFCERRPRRRQGAISHIGRPLPRQLS